MSEGAWSSVTLDHSDTSMPEYQFWAFGTGMIPSQKKHTNYLHAMGQKRVVRKSWISLDFSGVAKTGRISWLFQCMEEPTFGKLSKPVI